MATNYIQPGTRMTWTNSTGVDVSSGDVVLVEDKTYIACVDIADGASGELAAEGVYEVTKSGAEAMTQGKKVYWDSAQGIATHDVGASVEMGICWAAALAAATTVYVKLKP